MEKIIERGLLFDFYGDLLTEHQQRIYKEAVYNDLSLSELSQEEGISRQGVHDLIKRCDKILENYEAALHLIEKFQVIKMRTSELKEIVEQDKSISPSSREVLVEGLNSIVEDL